MALVKNTDVPIVPNFVYNPLYLTNYKDPFWKMTFWELIGLDLESTKFYGTNKNYYKVSFLHSNQNYYIWAWKHKPAFGTSFDAE